MFHSILLLTRWLLVVCFIGGLSFPAGAVTEIIVTTSDDVVNGTDSVISLREAVTVATAGDVIKFSLAANSVINLATEIIINKSLTIDGSAATGLIVKGSATDRVFKLSTGIWLRIQFLTLEGSSSNSISGGTIYNNGGTLELVSCIIQNGHANQGAIYNDNNGILTLDHCTIKDNIAQFGAAIYNYAGTVTVRNCSIIQNGSSEDGSSGSIKNWSSGTLNIISSTFSKNKADIGAGITNYGVLKIKDSTFSENETNSTTGNKQGGALYNKNAATATITNSTFSNNIAYSVGGGIYNDGTLTIKNSTIVENSADDDVYSAKGGGIYNHTNGQLMIANSIISANSINSAYSSPEIYNGGSFTSTGKNIFGLNGGIGIEGATPTAGTYFMPAAGFLIGNIVNDLANNGGPTQTRAPVFGGLAWNAGDNTSAAGLEYDQRGGRRILNGTVDIGAVEIGTVPLNDTGIQFCGAYPSGNNNPCLGTEPDGQDAHYGRDAEAAAGTLIKIGGGVAGFDYTKIANDGSNLAASATLGTASSDWACTRDNVTGLIWEVKTDNTTPDLRDKDHTYTWYDSNSTDGNPGTPNGGTCTDGTGCDTEKFVADVNAAGLCGYSDWRMPTPRELMGIGHLALYSPAIDLTYFPNTADARFWSGTPNISNSALAWQTRTNYGYILSDAGPVTGNLSSRSNPYRIRLVRGGISPDSFIDNGDGTVTQLNTGLMWAKCAAGKGGTNCETTVDTTQMSWPNALTAANNSELGGYTDWRLPNIKELQAITDPNYSNPVINLAYFPQISGGVFWPSSPFKVSTLSWGLYFYNGNATDHDRTTSGYAVRFVRGGESFNTFALTVNKSGTGTGTVTSNGNLINCGVICSYPFFDTTRVTLTATPDASYQFAGWSGGGCSGIGDCVVTMDAAKTVTATFDIPYPLTITNNGHGTITGPNRCNNSSCENDYAGFITLTATPDADYQFAGWSGDCSDASVICTIPMSEARNVSATFTTPTAETGINWQSITPAPTTNDLYSVAYGNGLFVAVGDTGVILNSTDGISWTTPASVTDNMLNRVIWGGGQFVAVGESGTVLTSTNGSSWQVRRSSGVALHDVTWGGNQFVAVGDSGTILTSSDGVTWTTRTSGTPNPLMGMTWSGSQFVAVGYSGTILTSSDGMTWTVRSSGTADALGDVIWSGSQFVAVGGTGTILTSPDGVTWTARTSGAGGFWLFGVTWNGNQFVVLVFDGAGTILTSPNGINWTPQTSGITNALSGMTWDGSQFVAVGNSGTILISPPIPQTLTVNKNGIGSGTITSNVGGIGCGTTCNANINYGELVTLTATPTSGSLLGVWGGCIPVVNNPWQCQVTMSAAKTVTATFITAGLNDTGITKCANATTNDLDCSALTGFPDQDAEHGSNRFNFTKLDASGNPLPASATNHVCVKDNVTGLIWEVKTDNTTPDLRDKDWTYTWYNAGTGTVSGGTCETTGRCDTEKFVADVNASGLCGFNDWRMPYVKELTGIADLVRNNPAIDIDYFPNTLGGVSTFFWSGSPRVSHANPWELASYSGETNTLHNTTEAGSVRLVRGGQSIDTFVDNGDGTVTQSNTGLMWAKCAKGLTGTDCGTGTAITEDWATVLTVASDTTLAGYNDWRLPNAKELQSLVDYGQTSPSINFSYFPNTPSNHFWSSSTLAQNASFALGLYFGYGANLNSGKNSLYHVRLVRGGQRFFAFGLTTATTGTGSGTVATDLTSGISCGANCQVFNERTIVVLTAAPNAGSTFTSWNGCTPLVGHPDQCYVTIDAVKTVTATFDLEKTLTVNITGIGTITATYTGVGTDCSSNCVLTYPNNAAVALNATPLAGYSFTGWSGDCAGAGICSLTMTANKTVSANFTLNTYLITATADPIAGGSVSCSPNPVAYNGTANCTATANSGYTFNGFGGDCTGLTCALTNVTANKAVTANFMANSYSITATANPTAGGSISCSPNPVVSGNTANCTATPNTGYALSSFSGDCSGATCALTNVTANKNVTANFTPLYSITATANPVAGGTINCTPNPVASGADANCMATPNTGYALSNFSGDCSGATCVLMNVTAAKAVTANFTPLYSITTTANPIAGGSISCSPNPVASGADANCTATPNAGYALSNFSGDCTGSTCVLTNVTANKTVTANFTATYSITATANPTAGGSIICSPNPVTSGADANCMATPNTGYALSNFSGDCTGSTCVLTNVTANKTVIANFTANTYLITATANPTVGGSVSCSPNPVTSGNTTNCTAIPNIGYTFNSFSGDCSGTTCVLNNVTAAKAVTANFTPLYSITATANPIAGGSISCLPNPVASGNTANCTATPNIGYALSNFSGDCSGATCVLTNVTANKNVTANFTAVTYSITATANPSAGGSISCSPNPVAFGTDANCTATANSGYALSNFSGDCSGATCVLTNVTAAKAVTANFTPLYSITATANPVAGGTINCTPNPVASGADANCTATPNAGYPFNNFSGDCTGSTCVLTNVTANKTVIANFTANTYLITATANPTVGGSVSCSPNPVASGADANCTATPNTGYALSNFSGDCSGATCVLTNVTADKTVTANFTAVTYSITATANPIAGGSINCSPNPVASGADANCTATPNTGYALSSFSGDCSGATCVLTNVTAAKAVTANFTPLYSITATANPVAGGIINCTPNPVTSGGTANCMATPNVGYALTNFSSDCSGATCVLTNVTAAKAVTANFTPLYSITATANPIAGGSISCLPNPVASGADANCMATPNVGYALTNFSGDCNGTTCALTNVTANKTVTANFTLNSYSITATANPTAGGSISCLPNPVASGADANCTATPNAGYVFTNFSGDCSGTTCSFTNVIANKTVTANFTLNTYSITATANPTVGGSVSCSPNPVTSDDTANCTATPNAGYTFTNFSDDCSGTTCAFSNVTANKTVTANFTAISTYSITATANPSAGGTVNCSPNPVTSGNTTNCTATPNVGYTFNSFSGDCSGTKCALTNVTANKTVTANFTVSPPTVKTYKLLIDKTGSGTITSDGLGINCGSNCTASFNEGTAVTLTATPAAGETFIRWSNCDSVNAAKQCVVTLVRTKLISATFTANVAPIADFVITDITLSPLQPNAGSAFNAAITVKNQGTTAMSGGTLSVWGDLPTGKNCGASSTVKTAIGVLGTNEAKTFTVSLPPMTSGNKRLRVFADSTCGTYEANERNNQSFLDYRVE